MLLNLLNRFPQADRDIRSGQWRREFFRGRELSQLTIGILGYGHMGKAFAKRLGSFGCKVLAYDPKFLPKTEKGVSLVPLEKLQQEADVLSIHFPLTKENESSIDAAFLKPFQKKLILLNTSRGKNLNLPEVYELVKKGKVTQLGLDVLPEEPPHGALYEEMFADERVLFTPHVAGWTFASYRKISEVLAEKVLAFYEKTLPHE
jgi:D-3-phosphoglycerate dehydrogenase